MVNLPESDARLADQRLVHVGNQFKSYGVFCHLQDSKDVIRGLALYVDSVDLDDFVAD